MATIIIKNIQCENCVSSGSVIDLLKKYTPETQWERRTGYFLLGELLRVRKFSTQKSPFLFWYAYEYTLHKNRSYVTRLIITTIEDLNFIEKIALNEKEGVFLIPEKSKSNESCEF